MDEREIKEKMVVNKRECITYRWQRSRPGWSPIKENVSLTDGRDQGQDCRQPKRMYHLQMVEIKARMVANQRECITYGDRDHGKDGRQPKRMYHLRMIEIKARMVVNQRECITYRQQRSRPGWSSTKENVSLTDGRDQGKDGRQPKRMYHLRMVEIKARMVANQRECFTYGWQRSRQRWLSTKKNVSLTDGRD